jgi:predicted lipoprotein with Yx(FWY)xxD motif
MKTFWTVIIVIVVIAVLGYGGYRIVHHITYKPPAAQPVAMTQKAKPTSSAMAKPSSAMMENSVYKSTSNAKLGTIMVDPKGMTLYTFTKDKPGVSNCSGGCMAAWPAYKASSQTGTFPANISVIKHSDGTYQYAWKDMPLYYFASDKNPGDANGQGVAGAWNVVKL